MRRSTMDVPIPNRLIGAGRLHGCFLLRCLSAYGFMWFFLLLLFSRRCGVMDVALDVLTMIAI